MSMKKTGCTVAVACMLMFLLTSCSKPETPVSGHKGVNAEILEITHTLKGFVVKALDLNGPLGEKCYVSCESPDVYYVFCDNQTGDVQAIQFTDFAVGDEITVDIGAPAEPGYALASRVQLMEPRP